MIQLYEHQRAALEQTKDRNRVAYYLDMGLGKTFVASEKAMTYPNKILVVCQKSKVDDWCEHFAKYYQITPFNLTNKKLIDEYIETIGRCVGVINYDLLYRRKELLTVKGFTLILDESSLIQNEAAKRSEFVMKLEPQNMILLSGTPVSGKYENLWTQGILLGWKISRETYQRHYINWITQDFGGTPFKTVDKENPYKNIERLKNKLREHGAVFMKTEDCFNLPETNEVNIQIPCSKDYRIFKSKSIVTTEDGTTLVGDTNLVKMLYERQLCGMYSKEKLGAFKDIVQSTQDRLIVFYNFNKELEAMLQITSDLERPTSVVNGKTKDLRAYENEENSITFVQYQAGAMGLNLQKSNKVIYFTLPLMSELYEQSKKRIHRIGQERPCFYYTLIMRFSVEKKIQRILKMRKDFTDELFDEGEEYE